MINRIKEFRQKQGFSLQDLADKVGTSNQQISMLERGVRQLTTNWMDRIAPALGVNAVDLISTLPSFKTIMIVGAVEAGVLKESTEWPESEHYSISIPLPDIYEMAKPFALEVHGPSMNKRYPDGSILICANMYALNEDPVSGKRYVIEKIYPDGMRETTVKRIEFENETEFWLWPESNDPNYQAPEKMNGGGEQDEIEIRILARVLKVIVNEE